MHKTGNNHSFCMCTLNQGMIAIEAKNYFDDKCLEISYYIVLVYGEAHISSIFY